MVALIFGSYAFEAGADWITVSVAAHIANSLMRVRKSLMSSMAKFKSRSTVTGQWKMPQAWVDLGITQAIHHRSRDAELAGVGWTEADLVKMRAPVWAGYRAFYHWWYRARRSVPIWSGIKAKTFIASRALAGESAAKNQLKHWKSKSTATGTRRRYVPKLNAPSCRALWKSPSEWLKLGR